MLFRRAISTRCINAFLVIYTTNAWRVRDVDLLLFVTSSRKYERGNERYGCRKNHESRADRIAFAAGACRGAPRERAADVLDCRIGRNRGEREQGAGALSAGEL